MPDKKKDEIIIETVHGVKTTIPKDWCEKSEKNVKERVDKDDTV